MLDVMKVCTSSYNFMSIVIVLRTVAFSSSWISCCTAMISLIAVTFSAGMLAVGAVVVVAVSELAGVALTATHRSCLFHCNHCC